MALEGRGLSEWRGLFNRGMPHCLLTVLQNGCTIVGYFKGVAMTERDGWAVQVAVENYEYTISVYCRSVVVNGTPVGRW